MEIIAIVIVAVAVIGVFVYTYRDTTNNAPVVDTASEIVVDKNDNGIVSVSYTHLTLPTICSV